MNMIMNDEPEKRKNIYEMIRGSPGIHLRELERRLDISLGNLQYHLNYLEKKNLISRTRDEEYIRFFIINKLESKEDIPILSLLRRQGCRHILINLLQCPFMTNKELAEMLELAPSTISWHLRKIDKAGVLTKEKKGREVRFSVKDPEKVATLMISYRAGFLDSLIDNFSQMWDLMGK